MKTKPKKSKNNPLLKEYTKTVTLQNKGKDFKIEIMNIPYTPEHIASSEAVKRGLFTGYEMTGFVNCYGDDLWFLFNAIDKLKGAEKIDKLNELKTRYQDKFNLSKLQTPFHHRKKLFSFIDIEIRKAQKEYFLMQETISAEYKPLLLKDIARKFGCTLKTMSRRIKNLKKENKFIKEGIGRYYSATDLQKLEKILGCSLSKK